MLLYEGAAIPCEADSPSQVIHWHKLLHPQTWFQRADGYGLNSSVHRVPVGTRNEFQRSSASTSSGLGIAKNAAALFIANDSKGQCAPRYRLQLRSVLHRHERGGDLERDIFTRFNVSWLLQHKRLQGS